MNASADNSASPESNDQKTWNSAEQIAEHRAMTPEQRIQKMVELSRAALAFAHAERVDGK